MKTPALKYLFNKTFLLKRESDADVLVWTLTKLLRTPNLKNICKRLLLKLSCSSTWTVLLWSPTPLAQICFLQFQLIGGGSVLIKVGGNGRSDDLTINKGGSKWTRGGGLKNFLGKKWQATITLKKIRKANQSSYTMIQSRNIKIYVFETSLIRL